MYLFLSHLPYVEEEVRHINGREEVCLIIPTKTNQLKRGRQGNWIMLCRLAELAPNAKMQTHDVQLSYLNEADLQKSLTFGYHKRTAHMGRVYEHDRTPEKKIDRTNRTTDINVYGSIILSDIPKNVIFANAENQKRYVTNLVMRNVSDYSVIYTGTICVDDIPKQDILTDSNTGKKYINVRFIKLHELDTYMNTHQLIIAKADGSEIEIGRFKEWRNENGWRQPRTYTPPAPDTFRPGNQKQSPDEINGIKF